MALHDTRADRSLGLFRREEQARYQGGSWLDNHDDNDDGEDEYDTRSRDRYSHRNEDTDDGSVDDGRRRAGSGAAVMPCLMFLIVARRRGRKRTESRPTTGTTAGMTVIRRGTTGP
jgi:hypothetical protein